MENIGKVFEFTSGQRRRCLVCEGLFTRDEAAAHATVPCQPAPESQIEVPLFAQEQRLMIDYFSNIH